MRSVAVIGGGITGLTAAFRLARKNIPVTLYEAGDRLGGVIQSTRQGGYLAEYGPNTILETSPQIAALVSDLGLEGRRLYSDPAAEKRFIVRGGKPVALPGSPVAFFTSPLFSASAKLHLLAEPFIRRAPADREESVAEFVLRRLGQEFLDRAINPFVAGVYAGDPARLSVRHAFPKLEAVEQRYGSLILGQILGARERKRRGEVSKQFAPKFSFDQGLQVLIETLANHLGDQVRLQSRVRRLEQSPDGWMLAVDVAGRGERCPHAAVLCVSPAYRLAEIELATTHQLDWSPLKDIYYPPVATVVLGFRREDVEHPLDGFGMLIPKIEGFRILGSIFSSSLFPNRAPAGHVTVTSYVGGVRAPELASRPYEELVRLTVQDLRTLLGVRGEPVFQNCYFYPKAIPQYEVGYGRFKDLMSDLEARAPGLFLAGHYREGISLGDSILSGQRVVDRIETFLGTGRGPAPSGAGQLQSNAARE